MRKLLLLAALVAGAFIVGAPSTARADHFNSCGPGFGGGYYGYSGYSRSYYAPVYRYNYGPVNSFGYAYPSSGFFYNRPGFSISIGSGYRGFGYGSYGGYGHRHSHRHHHHR